ncbi:Hypothetical protein PHPALM_38006 [Phytophthora palmivora]|uniref:Transmembrane protein n=1 Tax=Phytophthora palmivora TaxID=4796 RepID=A0A2P4WW06_9STRA|nr:Hypothetical protein PHPALM_38006 [Phytophthora palmivora]
MAIAIAAPCSQVSRYSQWIAYWGRKLLRSWFKVQVSHRGGKYSLERLLALEEYTRTTSFSRVILVCVGTPLPIMTLVILQELIPLQEPNDGPRANYGFWIRVGLLTGVVAHTAAVQAEFLVSRVSFTRTQLLLIFWCVAITFPLIMLGISSALVFPIPFVIISALPVFYLVLIASFRGIAGQQFFNDMVADKRELTRYIAFIGFQAVMVIVYPIYQTLFIAAIGTRYEAPVIFLLPLIKVSMKYLLSISTVHVEDLMPEAVIFTAEFFNSLYLATFMQRTSAVSTLITVVILDFCQIAFSLYSFYIRCHVILACLQELSNERELLSSIYSLCNKPEIYQRQTRTGIRTHSHFQHQLSDSLRKILDTLNGISKEKCDSTRVCRKVRFAEHPENTVFNEIITIPSGARGITVPKCSTRIQPLDTVHVKKNLTQYKSEAVLTSSTRRSLILNDTLEALFTSECLVLTEYLESLIPVFYGSFVLVIIRLPNIKYHMDLEGVTTTNVNATVHNVFTLGLLEIVSFVIIIAVMQRSCRLKLLYQLAFVLETQMMLVQDKIAIWMLMTMAFRVVHFDFSFQFSWITQQHQA